MMYFAEIKSSNEELLTTQAFTFSRFKEETTKLSS